jgi:ATP-dependent metalloprotease FtsH
MLQNSNKNNKEILDKNLKLMGMSAIVLAALFIYTVFKSSSSINSLSYYLGLVFLFVLLFLSLMLRFYKDKLKQLLPKNKFSQALEKANENAQNNSSQDSVSKNNLEFAQSNITFKDVAGIQSVKEELEEVVDFLNSPKKYLKHGIKLPKGVLLVGPPGVGKTLIARAVAGEAKVPFLYQSGASFVHIYVGMGAKRVRELFAKAKANAPAIIFIDEIDAVGKSRSGNSNDEREATLNELLTQMDGFDGDSAVIVIAATNKIEVLDEALLRAGRFDRRVFLNLPNIHDREKILNLYLKGKKFDFDVKELAFNTAGFSSAALATLINEALLNMVKRKDNALKIQDIETAKSKVEFGKKEKKILTPEQKNILGVYQASKAFVSQSETMLFQEGVKALSDIFPSKTMLMNQLKNYLAGSVGVEILMKEAYVVSTSDLKDAYALAKKIVEEYKMAEDALVLIQTTKEELKTLFKHNHDEIFRLKEIILHQEVIKLNDFTN